MMWIARFTGALAAYSIIILVMAEFTGRPLDTWSFFRSLSILAAIDCACQVAGYAIRRARTALEGK